MLISKRTRLGVFWWLVACAAGAVPYTVTSRQDSGAGTLREAIVAANAAGVPATIAFDMAVGCPVNCQIALVTPLPVITVPLTIDGFTQPGASPNTLAVGDDAVLKIVLNSNYQGDGFQFGPTAANSVVRGLYIVNFNTGIDVEADGIAIEGNQIGIDGMPPVGPAIVVGGSANNVRIGGTSPAQRNFVARSSVLIASSGAGTLIQGNYIGSNPDGSYPDGGILFIDGTVGNVGSVTIGGVTAGAGNLLIGGVTAIASNGFSIGALTIQGNTIGLEVTGRIPYGGGITLAANSGGSIASALIGGNTAAARNLTVGVTASGVSALTVQGNYIGCNRFATEVVAGVSWAVSVDGNASFGGSAQIGGSGPGEGNILAGGSQGGVRVGWTTATIEGNFIGIAPDLKTPLSNAVGILVDGADASIGGVTAAQRNVIADNYEDGVRVDISTPAIRNAAQARVNGNSIYNNGRLGIYFAGTGQAPLPNDPGDGDSGPNGFQNYPVMTAATISGGQVFLTGDLDSMPNTLYRIEWFANTACDPSGYGEGRLPLGGGDYMTDGSGHATFTGVMRPIPTGYSIITATATDPAGNTSEFSPCLTATGPSASFYSLPPCRLSDTRNTNGPYGGPSFLHGEQRSYVVAGQCGVPSNAVSVALNVAVTAPSGGGNLVLFAGEAARPATSTINYAIGRTKSDSAIVPLGPSGDFSVFANQAVGRVDVIIDVTGYFQ